MIYTKQTKIAMQIAFDTHKEQKDKNGLPYIYHPTILANQMDDELSTTVALLHDVVEDSKISFQDLLTLGISEEAVEIIKILTKEKDISYEDYIIKIKQNKVATKVKIADLTHNMDTSRLDNISERDMVRLKKYKNAMKILTE